MAASPPSWPEPAVAFPGRSCRSSKSRAFETGRFVLVVDGHQISDAEQTLALTADSAVTFLRLVPLRGWT